jgi:hypothetical protein
MQGYIDAAMAMNQAILGKAGIPRHTARDTAA